MQQQNDKMHPEDMRNMVIFFVLAIGMYFLYDTFVQQPQQDALQQQRERIAELNVPGPDGVTPLQAAQPKPREEVLETAARRILIENAELSGSLNLKGARLDDIALREYKTELNGEETIKLLSPRGSAHSRYIDHGWVAADKNTKLPNADTVWSVRGNDALGVNSPVTLTWNNGQGLRFERIYTLDENYLFAITQRVINNSGREVTLYPYGLITQTGLPKDLQSAWISYEGPMGYIGEGYQSLSYKDLEKKGREEFDGNQGWIALTDKYWHTSLIPTQGRDAKYRFNYVPDPAGFVARARYQVDYTGAPVVLAAGADTEITSHIFAGAKRVLVLEEYEDLLGAPHMDLSVDFGTFYFMTKPFFYILHYFGEWTGNMGIAIILLTIMIRSAVFPLTNASYKSFAKMKKVSPKVMELRELYKDDNKKLQTEIMGLYQKEGVNPLAGCFPILLQIPIFFALYKVLFVTIEIRHAPFYGWIEDLSAQDPTSIFNLFGLLPFDVPTFLQIGIWPCMMLVVMLIQKKLNPPPQDPLQRDMMNFFPFIITLVMAHFAAGLVIYWTFSALISVLQQMFIMKRMGVPIHLFGETEDEEKMDKAVSEGPAVHPLVGMAEKEAEEALFDKESEEPAKPISPPKKKKSKKKKK